MYITVNGREDTVLLSHAQYGKMKAELELLKMLAEAQDDVDNGRTAAMQDSASVDIALACLDKIEHAINLLKDQTYYGVQARHPLLRKMKFRVMITGLYLVFYKVRERDAAVIIYAGVDSRQDYVVLVL